MASVAKLLVIGGLFGAGAVGTYAATGGKFGSGNDEVTEKVAEATVTGEEGNEVVDGNVVQDIEVNIGEEDDDDSGLAERGDRGIEFSIVLPEGMSSGDIEIQIETGSGGKDEASYQTDGYDEQDNETVIVIERGATKEQSTLLDKAKNVVKDVILKLGESNQ